MRRAERPRRRCHGWMPLRTGGPWARAQAPSQTSGAHRTSRSASSMPLSVVVDGGQEVETSLPHVELGRKATAAMVSLESSTEFVFSK